MPLNLSDYCFEYWLRRCQPRATLLSRLEVAH
jgi:hypothetical protein